MKSELNTKFNTIPNRVTKPLSGDFIAVASKNISKQKFDTSFNTEDASNVVSSKKTNQLMKQQSSPQNNNRFNNFIDIVFKSCFKADISTNQQNLQLKKSMIPHKQQKNSRYYSEQGARLKSSKDEIKTIKIGSIPQKYDFKYRSEQKQKVKSYQNNKLQLNLSAFHQTGISETKKTQRRKSPQIFICTQNSSNFFDQKNKKLDLQKTKKLIFLKSNGGQKNEKLQQIKNDSIPEIPSFHNHFTPKSAQHSFQHDLFPNICSFNKQTEIKKSLETALNSNYASSRYYTVRQKNDQNAINLQRKLLGFTQRQKGMANALTSQKILDQLKQSNKNSTTKLDSAENLLTKQQIQLIIQKLNKQIQTPAIDSNIMYKEKVTVSEQNLTSLALIKYPSSFESLTIEEAKQFKPYFSFYDLQLQKVINKESYTLRATDNNAKKDNQSLISSPMLSQRKVVQIMKRDQNELSSRKNRLQRLDEGAYTIISKYDTSNSQKKSIVQQSVILFQCSKDLKSSFLVQNEELKQYARKYRGSLGEQFLMKERNERNNKSNEKEQNMSNNDESNISKIVKFQSNNGVNSRIRKSYSIGQNSILM